ncbi:endoglucanase II [Coprinopsis cinerea okayama7|uniref:lytic cellulose monooxygenase (C4-dehydrogenating) n=1 Tax=Coprinopsis cinerea (strain Okayama-7 / 130 / ATCC MYA-4618 / FGSC 9003) TaxID=240176 RepID=A8NBA9_COPC7|nr:endoglucanase II [Coprinopsis cinerea okayama7\|eukprot:XP_001832108.1 endoglucanase II [Coprinopsis cinerea okayama7\
MFQKLFLVVLLSCASLVTSHYTYPELLINGRGTGQWVNVRRTDNFQSNNPVTDVNSINFRCYNQGTRSTAQTATVAAGSRIGFTANPSVYHPSVTNIYMARAPGSVANWDGSGAVWFRVHEISANTNGGTRMTFPSEGGSRVEFDLPRSLPSGEYLVRIENIALHGASGFGGAQFYISCAQINVTGGGNGNPGPLVSIPGVYNGREPGIMLNIYYPVPQTYVMPGPPIWRG